MTQHARGGRGLPAHGGDGDVELDLDRGAVLAPLIEHDLAAMLIARGKPERARPHLEEALKAYRELGMDTWAARASALA